MPKTAIPTIIEPRALPATSATGEATIIESQPTIIESAAPGAAPVSGAAAGMFVPHPGAVFREWELTAPITATSAEADIWRMRHRETGEGAVLKLYRYGIQPKPEILAAVTNLRAASVVRLLDFGETNGRHFEIQEFAEHGTLADAIGDGSVQALTAHDLLRELHDALADVHESGIIHRDLKPANIFIRARDPLDLVLADFGISSLSDLSLHLSNANRTAAYAAPEAMTGVIARASDWWSVGVILIEILTGAHPFAGLDERTINFALVSRGITIPGNVPNEWLLPIKGLLTRDHKLRWGADQVGRWLNGERDIPLHYIAGSSTGAGGSTNGYRFGGREFHDLHTLALAMAEDWDEAVKRVSRRSLHDWVTGYLGDDDLANQLQDIVEDRRLDEDQKVCVTLLALDDSLPPVWRGEVVNAEWIALKVDVQELPTLRMSADPFSQTHDIPGDDDVELIRQSIEIIREEQFASPTLLQKRLGISMAKANLILDELHSRNLVGPKTNVLARDVYIGPDDGLSLSVRLLESSVPEWLQRLRGESWLADLAREHREAWEQLRNRSLPVMRGVVDQLLLSPHRNAVWPLLEERHHRFHKSTHPGIQALFGSSETPSRLDAIAIVATDERHFQTHTEAELSAHLLWLDQAGIHYTRTEAEELICRPDPERLARRAQQVRDTYVQAYPPLLEQLLTKDPLEFIEAIALAVARPDHFETRLLAWMKSAQRWKELVRRLRIDTRTYNPGLFNLSMREAEEDRRRWVDPLRKLKKQFEDVLDQHRQIFDDDNLRIDNNERSQADRLRAEIVRESFELEDYFARRDRSAVRNVNVMRGVVLAVVLIVVSLLIPLFVL